MGDDEGVPQDVFVARQGHLPHWQIGGRTYFLSFRCLEPPLMHAERMTVLEVVHRGREEHFNLHAVTVMPDHAHLLFTPREFAPGRFHDLSKITKGIKGTSAQRINRLRGRKGQLWQAESHDRIIRDEDEFSTKWNYIFHNPVWARLVSKPEEYPYFWSEVFDPNSEHQ